MDARTVEKRKPECARAHHPAFLLCVIFVLTVPSLPCVWAQPQQDPLDNLSRTAMPVLQEGSCWHSPQEACVLAGPETAAALLKKPYTDRKEPPPPSFEDFLLLEGFRGLIRFRDLSTGALCVELVEVRGGRIYSLGTDEDITGRFTSTNPSGDLEWTGHVLEAQIHTGGKYTPGAIRYLNGGALDAYYDALVALFGEDALVSALEGNLLNLSDAMHRIDAIGIESFSDQIEALQAVSGQDALRQAFVLRPHELAELAWAMAEMDEGDFQRFVGLVGASRIQQVFIASPGDLAGALRSVGHMGMQNFEDTLDTLCDVLGEETVFASFNERPYAFCSAAGDIHEMGLENFRGLVGFLEQEFGRSQVRRSFGHDARAFVAIAQIINSEGRDAFRAQLSLMRELFGRAATGNVFRDDGSGFRETLLVLQASGPDVFRQLVSLLGTRASAEVFAESPYVFALVVGSLYEDVGVEDFGRLVGLLGADAVSRGFVVSPYEFGESIKAIDAMGLDNFESLTLLLGSQGFANCLARDPLAFNMILRIISEMGQENFRAVAGVLVEEFGQEAMMFAFTQDAHGFSEIVLAIHAEIGVENFRQAMDQLCAEFGREQVTAVLVQETGLLHINRFHIDDLREIVRNRINDSPDTRPLAVVIYAVSDWNGAFTCHKDALHSLVAAGYRLMYYEVSSEEEMVAALNSATQGQDAAVLVIGGHGTSSAVSFGTADPAERVIRADEEMFTLDLSDEAGMSASGIRDRLQDGGVVILISCSTGEGECGQDNIANMLFRLFPQAGRVIAPTTPTNIRRFVYDDQNRIIAVEYTEDTDFDAASCAVSDSFVMPASPSLTLEDLFIDFITSFFKLLLSP